MDRPRRSQSSTLLTITQEEIDQFFPGVEGVPQEGKSSRCQEFQREGHLEDKAILPAICSFPNARTWRFTPIRKASPLRLRLPASSRSTAPRLPGTINSVGLLYHRPYRAMYQIGDPEQGAGNPDRRVPATALDSSFAASCSLGQRQRRVLARSVSPGVLHQ